MKFTYELNKEQTGQFHDIIVHALQSLTYQEAVLKDTIENYLTQGQEGKTTPMSEEEFNNLTLYLQDVTNKRLFLADVVASFLEQVEASIPKPIDKTIIPAQIRNPIDNAKEREDWVDSTIKDLLGE